LKVLKVAIGGDIRASVIAILTEDGGLWTFGDFQSRMLGNPALKAGLGKQVVPVRVPAFIGKKVLDVYCGSGQHMIVKVEVDL
jgi:alpha-tubulin suppressor-like RCC1 family protein